MTGGTLGTLGMDCVRHLSGGLPRIQEINPLTASANHHAIEEFVKHLPKAELHSHLDGSVRLDTLIELANEANVELPFNSVEELQENVFKVHYDSLVDYLYPFNLTTAVLHSEQALERVAYEMAKDFWDDGVRLLEVRFAPHLHMNPETGFGFQETIQAVARGMEMAQREINLEVSKSKVAEPEFKFSLIACALRNIVDENGNGISPFYQQGIQQGKSAADLSLEMVKDVVIARDSGLPLLSIDLAGAEAGFRNDDHFETFKLAADKFLFRTVHAGEAYGPESVKQAVAELHAQRIGHGFHVFSKDRMTEKHHQQGNYVEQLTNYVANLGVAFEVCLTSNMQTMPELKSLKDHPFRKMVDMRLNACLCTDNTMISRTTLTKEITMAIETFDLKPWQLKDVILNSFHQSFFDGEFSEKKEYVRRIRTYYDKIEEHFIQR